MLAMPQAPLSGEQSAIHGFRWQYDHIARLVYNSIVDADFDRLHLVSTDAGQIDDLVLDTRLRRDAYQYKSGVSSATISFNELLRAKTSPNGSPRDSLWRALASAWQMMDAEDNRPLYVHLTMTAVSSTSDHLTEGKSGKRAPDHFRAFLARALIPARDHDVESLPEWNLPFERLMKISGLSKPEFQRFLHYVRLDFGTGEALTHDSGTRETDIRELSNALYRKVSESSAPVSLDREHVLALMGWEDRKSFRSIHDFPVNQETYSPLTGAIDLLHANIDRIDSGYIAVTGAPGSGKSTLLTQTLSGHADRIVRYYAFVPGGGGGRNRLSADWFLHDLSTMLRNAGLDTRQKQLTSTTVQGLRQTVFEQLDAASNEFNATQRRTIIVVDGLDHVTRDYSGNDGLTNELPSPAEIPPGVIFVVGSRDLSPLPSRARQNVEDCSTEVNLEHQRLSRTAILRVCQSLDSISALSEQVHELVADRCAGHPLSLAYLLNRLNEYRGDDAVAFVGSIAEYDGDVAMQYREAWDQLDLTSGIERVLRVCSRLRVGFELSWVATWASDDAVRIFRTHLRYLFRVEEKRWKFFHDSFRQFARERTSIGDNRTPDAEIDRQAHAEVASICEHSEVEYINSQALFHWSQAGESSSVLRIGTQAHFRRQFTSLRATSDMAADSKRVLAAAATSSDFPALLRGLLILSEIQDKSSELEEIDVCRALLLAGRVDSAIAYVGNEQSLNVQLSHAYNLASDLARKGNASGLRVFEWVHHYGLQQPGSSHRSTTDSDVARAWARCAAHFLPLDIALTTMRDVISRQSGDSEWDYNRTYTLFSDLISSFVEERSLLTSSGLLDIDKALEAELENLDAKGLDPERANRLSALINALRYEVLSSYVGKAKDFEDRSRRFLQLESTLRGVRVYTSTLLGIAFLEAEFASIEKAYSTLARTGYDRALSLNTLGTTGDSDAIESRYLYWKLRHELEIGMGLRSRKGGQGPIESLLPDPTTPAGDGIDADAAVHKFDDAILVASRIDKLVRSLGLVSALADIGSALQDEEVWDLLGGAIHLFPPFERRDRSWGSMMGLRSHREEIHLLVFHVLKSASPALLERYQSALDRRFAAQPEEWPVAMRLSLGLALRRASLSPPWLQETIEEFEQQAPSQGVNAALTDLNTLVEAHVELGHHDEAARVLVKLLETPFGLGSQNDYQLNEWVQWLGSSSRDPDMSDVRASAIWLAEVVTAAGPLTDQSIGAEHLPAVIADASPGVALETFEYLVAHGGARHTDALANLLTALVQTGELTQDSLRLVADLAGEIVAGAGNAAHPRLARALMLRADPPTIERFKSMIGTSALGTTRVEWLSAFYEPAFSDHADTDDDDDYNALKLLDGSKLARSKVLALANNVAGLASVLIQEAPPTRFASTFDWVRILDANFPTPDVASIEELFSNTPHVGKVLVWLAEKQVSLSNHQEATRLARQAMESIPLESWSENSGATRRRAVRILVHAGAMPPRIAAQDLVRYIEEERWYSSMLHTDLQSIFEAIAPGAPAHAFWLEIREYLEGLAGNLDLPEEHSPPAPMVRWWLPDGTQETRARVQLGHNEIVAELAVIHISHPSWPVREGIARVMVAALKHGSLSTARALARIVSNDPTDDVLESIASFISTSSLQASDETLTLTQEIRETIAGHPNMVIRRLSAPDADLNELRIPRPLAPSYRLMLPNPEVSWSARLLGNRTPFLFPFEDQYEILAAESGLDLAAVLAVAAMYASTALSRLPEQDQVSAALSGASMKLANPTMVVLASRSAFGRVLGDLVDAGLLTGLSIRADQLLRTEDIELVGRPRSARPAVIPTAPEAGHDQTIDRWLDETEARLDCYVQASRSDSRQLVGAVSSLTVLNWGHLEEGFRCTISLRDSPAVSEPMINGRLSDLRWNGAIPSRYDMALLIENEALQFFDRRADWIAVHPVLARSLGWVPDEDRMGAWRSPDGGLAAETVDWNDGTWGRSGPMFNDVTSEGFATTLSLGALEAVSDLVGPLDVVFELERTDRERSMKRKFAKRRVQL
jgi:hypothetical protein